MKESTILISAAMPQLAEAIDEAIERIAGEKIAFSLIVYTPERASYISSCSREDSIKQLSYLLELWKAGMPDIPAHEVKG
jgi:hypothetical protein